MKIFAKTFLALILCFCTLFTVTSCTGGADTSENGSDTSKGSSADAVESSKDDESDATDESSKDDEASKDDESDATDESSKDDETSKDYEEMHTYKHVIVIGVDGAGSFFRDTNTPNIDKIFENGAVNYKVLTENPSISAQCWGSMLHGVKCSVHGLTNSIVENTPYPADSTYPSFFKVVRENDPDAKLGSFCNWNPINVGIVEDEIGVHKKGGVGDADITKLVCDYVKSEKPELVFVQFDEVDGAGHSSGYGSAMHLAAITRADTRIGEIYRAYEESGILEDTLFIVSADHGGHLKAHGGTTDTEKYVMFAAVGKTVEKGQIGEMEIRDTASVVLHAFGYKQPESWTSRVPSKLFKGVVAGERPVFVNKESERYHETVPTPAPESDGFIQNFLKGAKLKNYLNFDGNATDTFGATTKENGKIYYVDGYFGQAAKLDDGYISLKDYNIGKESFSISFWIKTEGTEADPVILSNKNWISGLNNGFVLCLYGGNGMKFNAGNVSSRMDAVCTFPQNFREGWMHVILTVDRKNGTVGFYTDFGTGSTHKIPESLIDSSFDAFVDWNIGQDGTGRYTYGLPAAIDEFMVFDGVLTREQIDSLKEYYK